MPKKGSEAVKALVIVVLSLIVLFALVSLFKGREAVVGKAYVAGISFKLLP